MGKNTPERQNFIIENLKVEKDVVKEETPLKAIARKLAENEVEAEV